MLIPHPDDDILSTAGTIQQAVEMGLPVKVVYLTNGDYNETSFALYRKEINLSTSEAYRLGETRREEALAAQGILGVKPDQVVFLGYPDGGGFALKRALAAKLNITPEQITLGNGSSDVIEFAARIFVAPGDEVVFSQHAFAM